MNVFVSKLLSNKLVEARNELDTRIKDLVEKKLNQIKLRLTEEIFGEANVLKMGRTKLVKVRVRKGKIQRRKKFSAVKGYTIRGGKLTRMMPAERRHRKISARRSKFKRRAKLKTALRKRKISLRKRTALGL
jgi:hypothetical protein